MIPLAQALRNYILQFSSKGKGGVDFLAAKNIRTHFSYQKQIIIPHKEQRLLPI